MTTTTTKPATNTPDPLALLTYAQAAGILQVSGRKVWSLVAGGDLPAVRLGRAVRIARTDLEAFIDAAKSGDKR